MLLPWRKQHLPVKLSILELKSHSTALLLPKPVPTHGSISQI